MRRSAKMRLHRPGTLRPRTATARARSGGFTLIEMLVVIAVISILAGFILSAVPRARSMAMRKKTLALIKGLSMAIDSFALDMGEYPDSNTITNLDTGGSPINSISDESGGAAALYFYLGTQFEHLGDRYGPYTDFSREETLPVGVIGWNQKYEDIDGQRRDLRFVADPWGNPLMYIRWDYYETGNTNARGTYKYLGTMEVDENGQVIQGAYYFPKKYQIFSFGPDGRTAKWDSHRAGDSITTYGGNRIDDGYPENDDDIANWE